VDTQQLPCGYASLSTHDDLVGLTGYALHVQIDGHECCNVIMTSMAVLATAIRNETIRAFQTMPSPVKDQWA
jgi:hypothetical protein